MLNLLEDYGPNSRISFGQEAKNLNLQKQFLEFCDKAHRKKRLINDWKLIPLDVRQGHDKPFLEPLETRLLNFLERSPHISHRTVISGNECRFCLVPDSNELVCLSELDSGVLGVAQEFFKVSCFDGFCQKICLCCLSILKSLREFNDKCKRSHLALLNVAFEEIYPNKFEVIPIVEETNDLLLLSNVSEAKSHIEGYSVTEIDVLSDHSDHDTGNLHEIHSDKSVKTVIKNHVCEYCCKGFRTKLSLKVHIRAHTNERPFNCSTCGKSFKTYSAVNNHRAAHSTDKKFECPVPECSYRTTTKANLNIHGRTHSQERFVLEIYFNLTVE